MTRFSDEAMEVFAQYVYQSDIKKMMKSTNELTNPLDIAFARLSIVMYQLFFQEQDKAFSTLLSIEQINKELKDTFIGFFLDSLYCWYYLGINSPIVDRDKAIMYLAMLDKKYQTIEWDDDFEKYMVEGRYNFTKGLCASTLESNPADARDYFFKSREGLSKVPEHGKYMAAHVGIPLASTLIHIGKFDAAELLLNEFIDVSHKFPNNAFLLFAYDNKASFEYARGKIESAMELIDSLITEAKRVKNIYYVIIALTEQAEFLFLKGRYDESLEYYNEILEYARDFTPLEHYWAIYKLFNYNYSLHTLTNEIHYWTKSEELIEVLQELNEKSENPIIKNFTKYTNALMLKNGNLRDKAKAMDILEELCDLYPNDLDISLNLIGLLFDDFSLSEDAEIMDQIDKIMETFMIFPLRQNPNAIVQYTDQQMLVAKYNLLMKRDPAKALEVLNTAKTNLERFNLEDLLNRLNMEIDVIEKEFARWDSLDHSAKKKLKTSEMRNYVKMAMVTMKKQDQMQGD